MPWAHVWVGVILWLQQKFTNPRRRLPYFSRIINKFPLKDRLFPPTEKLQGNTPPFRNGSWKKQQCFCSVLCRLQEFRCHLPSSPGYPALHQDWLIAGVLHHSPARSQLEPCSEKGEDICCRGGCSCGVCMLWWRVELHKAEKVSIIKSWDDR